MLNLNVLYVEDDKGSREVMRAYFNHVLKPRSSVILEDSTDFLPCVKALKQTPDDFLLDIHMKSITGFEMLKQLRAEPEFRHSKIVALTASIMNEEVEQLRASGFDGAISKPISISAFTGLIERIMCGETVWSIM
jgi:two-component system, sensor histidine kinase